ncbi:MAG: YhgE/Pip family protein [Clostridium sp.]
MKNIFRIFKRDIKSIGTNWVALVIVIGLILLPSLYAWFNIKACWDPYGSTQGIKVSIVNEDSGDSLGDKEINIGNELVENLKEDNNLGWEFVSREDGEHGVKNGEYYATIIIPNDFTSKTLSLVTKTLQKPEIIYMVNEKSNAIAPKITDKGVSTIKSQIDSNIVEEVNGIIFKVFNEAGIKLEDVKPRMVQLIDAIIEIDNKMPDIENVINEAYNGSTKAEEISQNVNSNIPLLEETLSSSEEILNNTQTYLEEAKVGLDDISPTIKNDLNVINESLTSVQTMLNNLKPIDKDIAISTLDNIALKVTDSINTISGMKKVLEPLGKFNEQIRNLIVKLDDINLKLEGVEGFVLDLKSEVENGNISGSGKLEELKGIVNKASGALGTIVSNYDSVYVPNINSTINEISKVIDNSIILIKNASNEVPGIKELLSKLNLGAEIASKEILSLQEDMPALKEKVSDLALKLKNINKEDQIDKLIKIIRNDAKGESEFLASPVDVKEEKLFPIPNYGSAMSPFYTILAQWVGALILVSLLTVDTEDLDEGIELKSYEKYLGKYLTFASIAILQSLVVTIGDLVLLKTYAVEPMLLIGIGLLASIVFSSIVYTLVSIFGNVGKGMAVILLVLQVAASGGTFPVEVTSKFFQDIYPFLPFTYAIGAMREAVAGVYPELLIKNISILLIYLVGAFILGLTLKGPINKRTKKLTAKLKESGLFGH